MKYDWRRFTTYGEFTDFASRLPTGWTLHSWQDVGGNSGIDIRALFVQNRVDSFTQLPEVAR